VWSMMQEKVYKHRIKDVDELCECIVSGEIIHDLLLVE